METKIEKYNPGKIQLIRRILEQSTELGTPLFYEIYVDDLKVVQRTSKVELFDNFEEFVNEDTLKIRINIYQRENSHRYTQHIFLLKENSQETTYESINSEIETKISERICFERNLWEKEQIKKELEETKQKLAEAEQFSEVLLLLIENIRLTLLKFKLIKE